MIRNAALGAAFLAAAEDSPITMRHAVLAVKREFQKLGRLRTEAEFDRYFDLVNRGTPMLHLLDESLEAFLRAVVPLPARDVDVAFDAPDGDWSAALSSRPTVNLYLWDVRPNLAERECGEMIVEEPDGRRLPPRPAAPGRLPLPGDRLDQRGPRRALAARRRAGRAAAAPGDRRPSTCSGAVRHASARCPRCGCAAATAARTRTSGRRWAASSSRAWTWSSR